jgi:hypothetical protein
VRDTVVAAWKKPRGTELALAAAADAVKRLKAGESWDAVAKSLGVAAQPPKFVGRSEPAVPVEIRRDAFNEAKPADQPIYSSVPLEGGDAAVLAFSAVREDPSGDPKLADAQLKREFAQQAASSEAQGYAAAARADAKVVINLQAVE